MGLKLPISSPNPMQVLRTWAGELRRLQLLVAQNFQWGSWKIELNSEFVGGTGITVTAIDVEFAEYIKIFSFVWFRVAFVYTVSGTGATIWVKAPVPFKYNNSREVFSCRLSDTTTVAGIAFSGNAANIDFIGIRRYDSGNLSTTSGRLACVQGFYRARDDG